MARAPAASAGQALPKKNSGMSLKILSYCAEIDYNRNEYIATR